MAFESEGFYNNSRSIAEDLGGTHHRARVVAYADNSVCTEFPRMRNHKLKGFFACGFTKIRKNPSPPPEKCSQAAQDAQGQGPCSDSDSTDNPEGLCDAKSGELKGRRSLHGSSLLQRGTLRVVSS